MKKEFVAGVILTLVFTGTAVVGIYGTTLPHFSIELKRGVYCFSGLTKDIFLTSLILWAPAVNTVIYLGLRIRAGHSVSIIQNKTISALLLGLFFGSATGIFVSLFVAGRQCG
ncbi:hypothetical protein [Paraglaciecola sp. 2405UD69-4]|uniref:hypothetical protein n=1 Tax=Paraglaciecola sp. 2405UD69-4 TaxID=3391836 RepID=UPI0039C928E2